MSKKASEVKADLLMILGKVDAINDAIRTTDFFNMAEIKKTLKNDKINQDKFNFVAFIHSPEFDPVLHIKQSRNLQKDVWLSLTILFINVISKTKGLTIFSLKI